MKDILIIDRRGGDLCRCCGIKHDNASEQYGKAVKECLDAVRAEAFAAGARAQQAADAKIIENWGNRPPSPIGRRAACAALIRATPEVKP